MQTSINRQLVRDTGNLQGHRLITDVMPLKIVKARTITESANGIPCNLMRLTGQIQYADRPNANGRIYPFEVLRKAVDDIQEDISERRILGEYDHPPDAKIHLDRISHVMTKVWMEGQAVMGEIEILPTTLGS